jgi:hypothetical protein
MIGAVLLFGLLATSGCQKPEEGLGVAGLPIVPLRRTDLRNTANLWKLLRNLSMTTIE